MTRLPYPNQPKQDNLDYGMDIVKFFAQKNGLFFFPPVLDSNLDSRGQFMGYLRHSFGSVQNVFSIRINLKKCKTPVKTPGFSWSYTGHKSDVTPSGVFAHEYGHYIDYCDGWNLSRKMNELITQDKPITSYEPNEKEAFAETMRLFILNPDLLMRGNIKRYTFLTRNCGFKPVIKSSMEDVLRKAHPDIVKSALSWIKKPYQK